VRQAILIGLIIASVVKQVPKYPELTAPDVAYALMRAASRFVSTLVRM